MTTGEQLDHTPLTFGKYKGKTPSEVAEVDPGYITWMYDTWADQHRPQLVSKALADDCRNPGDYDDEDGPWDDVLRERYNGGGS